MTTSDSQKLNDENMINEVAGSSHGSKALVIGLGLIGGSIAKALKDCKYEVWGIDINENRQLISIKNNLIDHIGLDMDVDIVFIATVASKVVSTFEAISSDLKSDCIITDVASVKSEIVNKISDGRFIGGHPMAGSEKTGPENSNPGMFSGATWVLTPLDSTSLDLYTKLTAIIKEVFNADPIALTAAEHDNFVALVSHVPYLTAVSLMNLASKSSKQEQFLLKLAAGGFRDMTRIASGSPDMWPDVCLQNSTEISVVLAELIDYLGKVKSLVEKGDRVSILEKLVEAKAGREVLIRSKAKPSILATIRIRVHDRPGELLEILTLAKSLNINIEDLQLTHSPTEDGSIDEVGTLHLVIDNKDSEKLYDEIIQSGYMATLETEIGL